MKGKLCLYSLAFVLMQREVFFLPILFNCAGMQYRAGDLHVICEASILTLENRLCLTLK